MKILHLLQKPQLRGAEVFASQLAKHSNESGHESVLVFLGAGDLEGFPYQGKKYTLGATLGMKRFVDVSAWKKLSNIIKTEKPDIIQANAGDTMKYAVFSKLMYRWKTPVVFRNASTLSLYIKSGSAKFFNKFFFKYASRIISVSNTSARDFGQLYPEFNSRIVTVPIGIEQSDNITPALNGAYTHRRPILMHVGGFTFEKNHKGLINIFEQTLKSQPTAELHLVGSGPLRDEIEAYVKTKGLQEKVIFHGYQKNPLDFISSADLLLLPSIIEGLPGVILEAFYCRVPVVAYDAGGIGEVVINNKTGRLVAKGDENKFSRDIDEALQTTAANKEMIENAYELVTSKYLNTSIAKEFIRVYNSVTA